MGKDSRLGESGEWDFQQDKAWYRKDVRQRMLQDAAEAMPVLRAANPDMPESAVPYSAVHSAVMTIIDQLFPNEGNDHCPTVCTSDVAWEVMYALGFQEGDALASLTTQEKES